jgi:4-carboxymuconolactone decarboxylase
MIDGRQPRNTDERRIAPVEPEELSAEGRGVFDRIAESRGRVAGPFSMLLHVPELADRVQRVGAYLRYEAALPRDVAELAVLVTARVWRSTFEWDAHVGHARRAGVSDEIIEALRADTQALIPDERLHAVATFTRSLATSARVPDSTYRVVLEELGIDGTVELTLLVGYYTMLAMTLGGHGLEPDPGTAGQPAG